MHRAARCSWTTLVRASGVACFKRHRGFKVNPRVKKFIVDFEKNNRPIPSTPYELLQEQDAQEYYKEIAKKFHVPHGFIPPKNIESKKEVHREKEEEEEEEVYVDPFTLHEGPYSYRRRGDQEPIKLTYKPAAPQPGRPTNNRHVDPRHPPRPSPNSSGKPESSANARPSRSNMKEEVKGEKGTERKTEREKVIPESEIDDPEVSEFFEHNFKAFWEKRAKHGEFEPKNAEKKVVEDKEAKEKKAKEEAEMKKKKEKKRDPTPEEVDQNARKYIKLFMMKIHPDFFSHDVERRNRNLQSLQQLNSFLDTIRQLREPKNVQKDKLPLPFSLSFYVKDANEPISASFHLPKIPTEAVVPDIYLIALHRRAYEGVAELIVKAKIQIDPEDAWVVEAKQEQENRDFASSRLPKHWRPIGWSPKDENYSLIEIILEHCRFMDISKQQRESPFTRHQEEKIAMFVKDFFYFDSLSPEECNKAIETFKMCIHEMNFDQWARIPVVFSTRKACPQLRLTLESEGFMVFPYDFDAEEAQNYVKVKLPGIKQRREALVEQARRDMEEVEGMKDLLKLALNPKDIVIEESVDREKRREKLARYMIRASRAVDIEMGYESNSILQNDYRALDFQRQQDREWHERREGNFSPRTLSDVTMLPLSPPPPFKLPSQLREKLLAKEEERVSLPNHGENGSGGKGLQKINSLEEREEKRVETPISSTESVLGPKLPFGKDANESSALRFGYTGLILDDENDDLRELRPPPTRHVSSARGDDVRSKSLAKFAGITAFQEGQRELSGEFYYGSSALHCLQQLVSLSETEMKEEFPWPAIKIVVSDHYHLDVGNPEEPTLYVPCYFTKDTLKQIMKHEGGSLLLKIQAEQQQHQYLYALAEEVREKLGVSSVKIHAPLQISLARQTGGLKSLAQCSHLFSQLGSLADLHIVLADTYALAENNGHPKLYIPFDLDQDELAHYLSEGVVPERYHAAATQYEESDPREIETGDLEKMGGFKEEDFKIDDEGNEYENNEETYTEY